MNSKPHSKMRNSLENSSGKSISLPSDNLTQAATTILSASTSVVGYVRLTPRKDEMKTPPQNSKLKKQFVSPIDKLLKKNGSLVDSFDMIDANMFIENNNYHSNVEHETCANSQLNASLIDINQLKDDHGGEEVQVVDYVSSAMLIKSPSTISMDSAKGSSIINEGNWNLYNIGDLFWGQIYNYCYWPCMICSDPDGKGYIMESSSRIESLSFHVRFFADNGRRSWVKRENLLSFVNLEYYLKLMEEAKRKYGSKSPKYKIFLPTKRMQSSWYLAITEASLVAEQSIANRMQKFNELLQQSQKFHNLERQINRAASRQNTISSIAFKNAHDTIVKENHCFTMLERKQSASPFNPMYSPIQGSAAKRRKISQENDIVSQDEPITLNNNLNPNSPELILQHSDIYSTADFRKFYNTMRDFVFEQHEDETLEEHLIKTTRNFWALKHLSCIKRKKQLIENATKLDSAIMYSINDNAMKRLSTRLKRIFSRSKQEEQLQRQYQQKHQQQQHQDIERNVEVLPEQLSRISGRKKFLNRPIEDVINDIFELDSKYLFRGMNREPVCKYCLKADNNLRKCSKNCQNWMHTSCLKYKIDNNHLNKDSKRNRNNLVRTPYPILDVNNQEFRSTNLENIQNENENIIEDDSICRECANHESTVCSVCHKSKTEPSKEVDPLLICTMPHCDRAFHLTCCKYWPQAKVQTTNNQIESFRCPCHVCHTCVSDDPKEKFHHLSHAKIVKCVKCPATYHCDSTCIPAGSEVLTAAYIICPRHTSTKSDMTVNVNWCFICVRGGQLICCETCPIAVHAQCLNIHIDSNEGYICEECESGRMPLYGEMVWAKFNNFRWWPAIILPPPEIPQNISKMSHNKSEFVVRFFGSHDHGWISRRRVYLYVEGDCSEPPKTKSGLDFTYKRGIEEAKRIYEIIKCKKFQLRNLIANKEKLQPQPYVRIKANRAVPPVKFQIDIEYVNKCECKPDDEDPCGPTSNCLNRAVYHECSRKVCPAGERCQNQMFESRISPRLDVVYMKERGFGLVCREYIPAGAFIIEYVGEVINDNEFRNRMMQKSNARDENFYFLSVEKDYIIDAGPKGNLARFMNHSCDPNCETQKWLVNSLNRVGLFAIKDIPENTELTFNYLWDDLLGNKKKRCYCGSKNCSGQIGAKPPKESIEEMEESSVNNNGIKEKTQLRVKTVRRTKKKRELNLSNDKLKKLTGNSANDWQVKSTGNL